MNISKTLIFSAILLSATQAWGMNSTEKGQDLSSWVNPVLARAMKPSDQEKRTDELMSGITLSLGEEKEASPYSPLQSQNSRREEDERVTAIPLSQRKEFLQNKRLLPYLPHLK